MEHLSQFIMNHWLLWLAFIIILLLTFINELMSQKKKAKELSPQTLVSLINEGEHTVIIDTRDKAAFKAGHIINAVNANPDDLEKINKYKGKNIVLVCAKGLQSSSLANKINGSQDHKVMYLGGGIDAWQSADLPLVKGK